MPQSIAVNRCDAVVQAIGRLPGPGNAGTNTVKLVPAAKDPVAPFTENKEYCGKLLTYICTDMIPFCLTMDCFDFPDDTTASLSL